MASPLKGFRDFALRGDLITVAVGLVMALATFELIRTIVEGLITPLVGLIVGEELLLAMTFSIDGTVFSYGAVVGAVITFLATAAVVYFLVVVPYRSYQRHRGIADDTRPCPECTSSISIDAKRCPHCTSIVSPAA